MEIIERAPEIIEALGSMRSEKIRYGMIAGQPCQPEANKIANAIKLIEALQAELERVKKEREWIPVQQKLPTENGDYLVFRRIKANPDFVFVNVVSFTTNLEEFSQLSFLGDDRPGWYAYDSEVGYYEVCTVTHWMPLPDQLKEVTNETD